MPSPCLCCLALQLSCSVINKSMIDRRNMFYSVKRSSSLFPKKHMLENLKPNFSGAKFLICNIFGLSDVNISAQSKQCFHRDGFCSSGSTCLFHCLLNSLKMLIRRTKKCQYRRLLNKHCPDPSAYLQAKKNSSSMIDMTELGQTTHKQPDYSSSKNCKRKEEVVNPQANISKPYCSKNQVVSFLWAVCRSIIPLDLLGTPSNQRIMRRNINRFVGLRRFEKFSIKQCLHKLKTSRFAFLSKNNSSSYMMQEGLSGQSINKCKNLDKLNNAVRNMKNKLLMNWIFWLFSCLVMPLVQANFYVTESEQGKQEVYYYRKYIWEKLTKGAIANLNDSGYVHVDEATVNDILSNRIFGFSKLRLLPKQNGVRMIANLKTSSRLPGQESSLNAKFCGSDRTAKIYNRMPKCEDLKSVNSFLRDTHAVLKGLQAKEPQKLGSSVFDYNDVYRKLCPFLAGLKDRSGNMSGIFIVVSDVSKAFDTIDQDKLLSVMDEVLLEDEYNLEQSYQVICPKRSPRVCENLALSADFRRVKSSVLFRSLHGVLVNQGKCRYMKKEKLFSILNELVKRNVLHLGNNFYLQGTGIPQGCTLSSLLCSLYYGHMERNLIYPFLEKTCQATELSGSRRAHDASIVQNKKAGTIISCPSFILLRLIDDYLFVSTSKEQAAAFFCRLQQGFGEYNCYMNREKFCVNFDIGFKSWLSSSRMYVGEDGKSFIPWSGLLINCCTLEVQGDYRRYLNNHLSSTLTICWQGKPGCSLKRKLCCFMRPKCHPVFLDSNINSAAVVRLNIYQVFLLCAMKFHCYVSEISYIYKFRARYYSRITERSIRYMNTLIKNQMKSMYLGPNLRPILQLDKEEVEWLGLHAFVEVLKKKQSRHKALLSLLRSKLSAHTLSESLSGPELLTFFVTSSTRLRLSQKQSSKISILGFFALRSSNGRSR
ncbi:telomerase reverse transcriptase isoform X2 [Carica papaya]|nr:telomerase reverse transcriptase isoform X2 [Carica papaya]